MNRFLYFTFKNQKFVARDPVLRYPRPITRKHILALAYTLWTALASLAAGEDLALTIQANVMVEATFSATRTYLDPFNELTLDVVFSEPRGGELRVPAFWASSNVWKVRYASPVPGVHRFRTECSEPRDSGLHGIAGTVTVHPYTGSNPLYAHGPLRVAAGSRYLEHLDHTPFFWLADTWWMGLCHRLHWPEEFRTLAADRKEKGFNVIQIVAGLYPDMPPFDPRGANEAGYPWETNYARIRPEYFNAADQRLGYLVDQGFTPCIVGAWGYFLPRMGMDKMKAHWRYLIARYGAWPVAWCAAGEANLPWYLAPGFPYDDRQQVRGWTEVMRYIRATDPFHRPLTVHPTAIRHYTARHATDDPALLDFDLLQTSHGQRDGVPLTVKAVRESYAATPRMPVIDGEASYEMLGDSLPTEWTRCMFWLCLMNGAAGHTYGANGIWQCNRPGEPHGKSPHGGSYGNIPWNEAMHLPGSRQMGLAKAFLEQYPWQRFEPHPEWAVCQKEPSLRLGGCAWIWFPEGDPAKDAPAAKRYFRHSFTLPAGKTIERASLWASGDDWCAVKLNGLTLGACEDWRYGRQFDELARLLKSGTNLLALVAENKPTTLLANPAGLLACMEIRLADGETRRFATDDTWLCATNELANWDAAAFDDHAWVQAMVLGRYGDGPWGRVGRPNDDVLEPQAAGIPGQVRIIYVPESRSIEVGNLGPQAQYKATYFDPVTGEEKSLGALQADHRGAWRCPPPSGQNHDWVLVLENR
ncbi:MAG TPA: DUF4038 domain-containing protein [Candidatus Acidoferrum sp.]|nr:DUF4038 domain-containing protein [Candidatus Acidoferrum sp.]